MYAVLLLRKNGIPHPLPNPPLEGEGAINVS
jgi:hypothetical protein